MVVRQEKNKVEEQKKEKREAWLSGEWQNCNITQDRERIKNSTNEYILQGSRNTVSV